MSERQDVAISLGEWVGAMGLDNPFGGYQGHSKYENNRIAHCVLFSRPALVDGAVYVYSTKYFLVRWETPFRDMPHRGSRVFETLEFTKQFINKAFGTKRDWEAAQMIPFKEKKKETNE